MDDDPFVPRDPQVVRNNLNWHSEQVRRAGDIIRVANPLTVTLYGKPLEVPVDQRPGLSPRFDRNGDYLVEWDTGPDNRPLYYRVPLNGTLEIDRYIADKYRRDMSVAVINYYGQQMGNQLLDRESKTRPELLLERSIEQAVVWDKVPRTDDEKLLEELWPQFWLGIVRENGLDNVTTTSRPEEADFRTTEERLMAKLGNVRAPEMADSSTSNIQADLEPNLGTTEPELKPNPEGGAPIYVSKSERERLAKEISADEN